MTDDIWIPEWMYKSWPFLLSVMALITLCTIHGPFGLTAGSFMALYSAYLFYVRKSFAGISLIEK